MAVMCGEQNSIGVIGGRDIVMCNREKYVVANTWIDAIKEEKKDNDRQREVRRTVSGRNVTPVVGILQLHDLLEHTLRVDCQWW